MLSRERRFTGGNGCEKVWRHFTGIASADYIIGMVFVLVIGFPPHLDVILIVINFN